MGMPQPLLEFRPLPVPAALREARRWAPWVAVWNAKRGKYDKIPHRARGRFPRLSTAKPQLWSSLDEAFEVYALEGERFAGLGYCMTGPHGVVGIDLDDCRVAGQPTAAAAEIIARLGSYTEVSPSGNGFRIFCRGEIAADWTERREGMGIEVYGGHQARFLTVTGAHVAGTPAELMPLDAGALSPPKAKPKLALVQPPDVPELLDALLLPSLEALPLPAAARRFLLEGEAADRSKALFGAGVALFAAGLAADEVLSLLADNAYAWAAALGHRGQDPDKALGYLWREHCLKAQARAVVAAVADFEDLTAGEGAEAEAAPWPPFLRDKSGRIEATIENVAKAVRRADLCGMTIRFDRFRDEMLYAPYPGDAKAWRPFLDADYSRLRITLEHKGFKAVGRELIRDVVLLVADENPFDSAQEWLKALPWDGVERIDRFLETHFGAADTPYTRGVSAYLWTALAGRALVPGIKADMVPILIGEQGVRKSACLAAMVPGVERFTEISFSEPEDNLSRKMRGRLLAEIGELRGLHSRELEHIKAFITRTHENWVPKYREFAVQFPRRLVFVGTTNKEEFLADETGNRRWLPLRVTGADLEAIQRDRDQLWAEARERFGVFGVEWQAAERLAKPVHAEHMIRDVWEERFDSWIDEPNALTGETPRNREFLRISEVARECFRIEDRMLGKRDEMRISSVLQNRGFVRVQRRVNGVKAKVWVDGTTPEPPR